jgi:hypothetical protein
MPVLLSYATHAPWLEKGYQQSFSRLLIDSGAFSEFNSGRVVDLGQYRDWAGRWLGTADAVAGLDDIRGDWRRSLKNYEAFPEGFPTFHETDPSELLDDLVAMAGERTNWLGLGLLPPREGKEKWVRSACDRVPDGVHVHGWALRRYTHVRRLDSVDSTNWFRDAMKIRTTAGFEHLTYGECLEIVVKRYQRWTRNTSGVRKSGLRGFFGDSRDG